MIDWREVDLGGAKARRLENRCNGVLVSGEEDDAAYVALVGPDGHVERTPGGGTAPVWSVMVPELSVYYMAGSPPRFHPGDHPESAVADSPHQPTVAAWELCGDEDPCRLTLREDGQLFAYEEGGEWPCAGPWLADGAADSVIVAGAEIGLLIAGLIADPTSVGGSVQAWRYGNEEWSRVDLALAPAAVTDAYTRWEPVLAGHRAGEPVVFSHTGTRLAAPRVRLDEDYPMVVIAHVRGDAYKSEAADWDGRLSLVVQEEQGVQLWLQHAGGWTMLPGPPGRLRSARLGYNNKEWAWCITDDRLWFADLSAIWDALASAVG